MIARMRGAPLAALLLLTAVEQAGAQTSYIDGVLKPEQGLVAVKSCSYTNGLDGERDMESVLWDVSAADSDPLYRDFFVRFRDRSLLQIESTRSSRSGERSTVVRDPRTGKDRLEYSVRPNDVEGACGGGPVVTFRTARGSFRSCVQDEDTPTVRYNRVFLLGREDEAWLAQLMRLVGYYEHRHMFFPLVDLAFLVNLLDPNQILKGEGPLTAEKRKTCPYSSEGSALMQSFLPRPELKDAFAKVLADAERAR